MKMTYQTINQWRKAIPENNNKPDIILSTLMVIVILLMIAIAGLFIRMNQLQEKVIVALPSPTLKLHLISAIYGSLKDMPRTHRHPYMGTSSVFKNFVESISLYNEFL